MTGKAKATRVIGILSVVFLDIALNFLLLKQEVFLASVVVPFLLGVILGIVWIVLSLTRLAAGADRGKTAYGFNAIFASAVFFGICVALYAFAGHWKISWDLTQEGRRELSGQTVQVLESVDQDVRVYGLFVSAADSMVRVSEDKTRRFLERCQRHTPYLKVEFADPEEDALILKKLDIKRVSPQGTVVVACGAHQRVIALSGANARLEERDFTNALINVIRGATPKVYFLVGHGEHNVEDADPKTGNSLLKQLLETESYVVDQLSVSPSNPQVPGDCDVLVINGQTGDLLPTEVGAFQRYLDTGGRFLLLLDLWRVQQTGGQKTVEQLRPWLKQRYGIEIGEDVILSQEAKAEVLFMPVFGALGKGSEHRGSFSDSHPITRGFDMNLFFMGARSVTLADKMPQGAAGDVLLRSLPTCWAETNIQALFSPGQPPPTPDPGERKGCIPVAVAVTSKTNTPVGDTGQTRDARIVVVGNREFAANEKLRVVGHMNLIMNVFAWLTESEELISIRATGHEDPPIVLSPIDEQVVAWIASLGLLHLVILAGLTTYLLRRKYQ